MFQIKANNITLDINITTINITRRSPVYGGSAGSYVYSLSVPHSPHNAAALKNPFRLQRKNKQSVTYPGEILFEGNIIQKGTWKIKSVNAKAISLEMLIDAGIFANNIAGKNLPELFNVPVSEPDIITHLESQVLKTYPEVNHNFPVIYNPQFYGDPTETDPKKNPNLQFEGFLNNQVKTGLVHNDKANKNAIVPQLYLAYVVRHIYESEGYTLKGTVLEDTMLKAALIYNNFALDKLLSTSFSGDAVSNTVTPGFFIVASQNIQDPGNLYNNATGEYTVMIAGDYQVNITGTFIPTVSTIPAGYALHVELWYDNILQNSKYITVKDATPLVVTMDTLLTIDTASAGALITWKAYYTDASTNDAAFVNPATMSIINTTQPNANIFESDFNYKDMVPNMSVKDFLKIFYKNFGILPFFNETTKTITLLFWRELLNTKTKSHILTRGLHRDTLKITPNNYAGIKSNFDFSGSDNMLKETKVQSNLGTVITFSFPTNTQGDIYYCESLNAFFRRDYNQDSKQFEWIAIGDNHPVNIIDEGKKDMSFGLAPMLMRNPSANAYVARNLPSISAQGTSDAWQLKNDCPLRLMFYVGITSIGVNGDYPLATTTKYDTQGNIVLPISWKTNEILDRYYPEWLSWLKRREGVEFTNEITGAGMKQLDFSAVYFFLYSQIILEEAYIKLQNKQIGPAKIKGWTV